MNIMTWAIGALMLVGSILAFYIACHFHKLDREAKEAKKNLERARRDRVSDK